MKPDVDQITARAAWLREQLDALPSLADAGTAAGSDWIQRWTRRTQAIDQIAQRLAQYPDLPSISIGGSRVRMLGITSTSTMGIEGALRNWITRAEALACTPRP